MRKIPITKLAKAEFMSPLAENKWTRFITDADSVILDLKKNNILSSIQNGSVKFFETAGPRKKIFFDPSEVKCGIVSCGGLCPGINDIIRELVFALWNAYRVREIFGFKYGYKGIAEAEKTPPIKLTPAKVDSIHRDGGSLLSSSRGPQDPDKMAFILGKLNINILFVIGGDGTMRGAHELSKKILNKKINTSVICIPKTIDNDISFVDRSFGFETAVQVASDIIDNAHTEAKGAPDCIGLVKVMGRSAGFIAAYTALANRNVNYCFVPEIDFRLTGKNSFMEHLRKRMSYKHHAVIIAAEGAGQNLMHQEEETRKTDASGNPVLKDVGIFLKNEIKNFFDGINHKVNIKYFDPSYIIRSVPANAMDSLYCVHLAQNAVHAAMSGRTDMLISKRKSHYIHVPIKMSVEKRKQLDPRGRLWRTVMEATQQPYTMFEHINSRI